MKKPLSHLEDPDMVNAMGALIRASKEAKKLAAETGTEYVIVRNGKLVSEVPPEITKRKKQDAKKKAQ